MQCFHFRTLKAVVVIFLKTTCIKNVLKYLSYWSSPDFRTDGFDPVNNKGCFSRFDTL